MKIIQYGATVGAKIDDKILIFKLIYEKLPEFNQLFKILF